MIPFFRKIRQGLLTESKFGKYGTYAIGEIILVVIGILIALQVNNWNEARKDRSAEHQLLLSVLADLRSNEKLLELAGQKIDNQIDHTIRLLALMQSAPADSSIAKVKKLLYDGTEVEDIQLNMSGIESIVNNKIGLITDDSIQQSLIQYKVIFEGYKDQEQIMRAISVNRIRPAVKNHIFLHTLSSGSQKFSSDFKALLSDRSLANDITDRMWESDEWKESLAALRKHGQKLIELIEGELR